MQQGGFVVPSKQGNRFHSPSIILLAVFIYLKHKRSTQSVVIDIVNCALEEVSITSTLIKAIQFIKQIGAIVRVDNKFDSKAINELLKDFNYKHGLERSFRPSLLQYNRTVYCDYAKDLNEPYPEITFSPYNQSHFTEWPKVKELYLGNVFKFETKHLIMWSCNFLTLHQYIP